MRGEQHGPGQAVTLSPVPSLLPPDSTGPVVGQDTTGMCCSIFLSRDGSTGIFQLPLHAWPAALGSLTSHQFIPRLEAQHSTAQQRHQWELTALRQGRSRVTLCHTHLVSVEATTNHIPTGKDINADIDVILAGPGQALRALQLLLLPVVVGEQPITGVKEHPGDKGQSGRATHGLAKGRAGCASLPPRWVWGGLMPPGQGQFWQPHLLSSFSSFCHLSVPSFRTLSYQITSPPGTALCTRAVSSRRNRGRFPTAAACQEGAGTGWARARGQQGERPRDRGRAATTHAQLVLDVDQPAVEAVALGNAGQLLGHGTERLLPGRQERLAQLLPVCPLRDECAWAGSEGSLSRTSGGIQLAAGAAPGSALPLPSTGTLLRCAALVQTTGGMVTVWWLK